MTAKLQSLTVRQAAQSMNVSERTVYVARELIRCGTPDIIRAVEEGRMGLYVAMRMVKPEKYGRKPDCFSALVKAWNKASPDERSLFPATLRCEREMRP